MYGVQVSCLICNKNFSICRKCWRGQKYCSKVCSKEARRRSRVKSQEKYRKSRNGKLKQSKYQNNFRSKRNEEKIVSDHSSKVELDRIKRTPDLTICIFCGSRISKLIPLEVNKLFSFHRVLRI